MHFSIIASRSLALGAVLILASWGSRPTRGAEANFWISVNDNGPHVPVIEVLPGGSASFDIWARPAAGRTLGGFSLDVESTVENQIEFQWVEVPNPSTLLRNTNRHQLVFDSNTTWSYVFDEQIINRSFNQEHLTGDRIEGFMGGTFVNDSDLENNGIGIGPACDPVHCTMISGEPAWRVATVDFLAGATEGSTEIFMDIGEHGVWHLDEVATDTTILFGDPTDGDPDDRYSWPLVGEGAPLAGLPDAIVNVVAQLSNADFNDSGLVDGADYLIWQQGLGVGTTNGEGDANYDGVVDDYDFQIWESQYGTSPAAPVTAVPEPSGLAILAVFCIMLVLPDQRRR